MTNCPFGQTFGHSPSGIGDHTARTRDLVAGPSLGPTPHTRQYVDVHGSAGPGSNARPGALRPVPRPATGAVLRAGGIVREALEQPAEKEPSGRRATDQSARSTSRAFGVSPNRRTVGAARAPGKLLRLQRLAGNGAVSRLVVAGTVNGGPRRLGHPTGNAAGAPAPAEPATMAEDIAVQRLAPGGACPPPAAPPTPTAPKDDPRFAKMEAEIGQTAKQVAKHPKPAAEAKKAAAAAEPPAGEIEAQAKAAHADKMDAAKPAGFDKEAFVAAVKAAIAAKAPKNLDEADKFASSGQGGRCQGGGRREGDGRQGGVSQGDRDHHR